MKWFRMYSSMVDSIKVGRLTDSQFRTYVQLQCLAGEKSDGGRTGVTLDTIDWRLRRDAVGDVTGLSHVTLVTVARDGELIVTGWDDRQKRGDTSAERTRKYRDRKSSVRQENPSSDGHGDVTVTGGDGHGDALEEKREEKSITPPDGGVAPAKADACPPCPYDKVVELYHTTLPGNPQVFALNDFRRGLIKSRWREAHERARKGGKATDAEALLHRFSIYFEHVGTSDFLTGKAAPREGREPFVADLEWLMRPTNFMSVIEGKYHGGLR